MTDTSPRAVKRLAAVCASRGQRGFDAIINGAVYGEVAATLAALLARAERAEAERDENEKVIAVWRGRTQRAEAERERLRTALRLAEKAMRSAQSFGSDKAQASADLAYEAVVAALKETGHE